MSKALVRQSNSQLSEATHICAATTRKLSIRHMASRSSDSSTTASTGRNSEASSMVSRYASLDVVVHLVEPSPRPLLPTTPLRWQGGGGHAATLSPQWCTKMAYLGRRGRPGPLRSPLVIKHHIP